MENSNIDLETIKRKKRQIDYLMSTGQPDAIAMQDLILSLVDYIIQREEEKSNG